MGRIVVGGILLGIALPAGIACAQGGEPPVDFTRTIRPILTENCFQCHGPDPQTRKGELRLDTREGAVADRGGHAAVVPGKADQSELLARITSADDALRMPPADSGKKLSDAQIAAIKRWIEQGAEYRVWWSFLPPERPPLPGVKNRVWLQNPIDAFILAKLEQEGIEPSAEADPATLLRRVMLDLTGLPPSPAEVDAYLRDDAPGAYERAVDRLLQSPRYGERMATSWLDAARYADTNGYEVDNARSMWHWRDWVVDAFNGNQPYDEFTVEQLAGDLLPEPTLQQQIATGFNRNHRLNFEAGTIPEEFRVEYVVDRVDTTSTVWLGLTMVCARCHDHKYDPITQQEFYRLFAYFNTVAEVGNGGKDGNEPPLVQVADAEFERKLDDLDGRLAAAESTLKEMEPRLKEELARWEAAAALPPEPVQWTVLDAVELRSAEGAVLKPLGDKSILSGGPRPAKDVYTFAADSRLQPITAVRLELLPVESQPKSSVGRHDNGSLVVSEVQLTAAPLAQPEAAAAVPFKQASSDFDQPEWESPKAIDGDLATGWAVSPQDQTYHFAVFETAADVTHDGGTRLAFSLSQNYGDGALIGRFRLSVTDAPRPVRAKGGVPEPIAALLAVPQNERSEKQQADLLQYFLNNAAPEFWSTAAAHAEALRKEKTALLAAAPTTMVMREMPEPRDTFVLIRGQYDRPGAQVTPGVPSNLSPLPAEAPNNRLGLARWLVDPANPLTARVAVNRFWQLCFGAGLVRTTENFGSQGALPSHPELLDWLAVDFVQSGWDVKRLQRLIVTSAVYRQSSKLSPQMLQRDPANRLLARAPRFRLPAEVIRDQALAAGGLLVERSGGPPVMPYQPQGLWEELSYGGNYTAQVYEPDHGEKLYRRSLYTFWKRTVPPPSMTVFDAPNRETCTVDRGRTNTPLQALALLNDVTYAEAARGLGQRMLTEAGASRAQQLIYAYRLVLARPPQPQELALLTSAFERYLAIYQNDRAAALKLVEVGESPRDQSLDAGELAAATVIGSVLINLDHAMTRE